MGCLVSFFFGVRCYVFFGGLDVLGVFNGEFFFCVVFFNWFLRGLCLCFLKGQNTRREGGLWGGGGLTFRW